MKEYYTRVSMDVAVVARSPEEATEKLNQWLDGQQMIDKSTGSDFWWENIDWDDWTITESEEG
jgi:hypothetical protein